ncbi:MAG: patatin-like phospholipase family protein [Candidatus Omnitrophica bacterium]|nr:patatin-like phospholipase family protein [Candidatus Omnitrophota bacterium]
MKKLILVVLLIIVVVGAWLYFVKGYVGIRQRPAVPANLIDIANVPGTKNIRIIIDPVLMSKSKLSSDIFQSGLSRPHLHGSEANILAISGGGANGAYGAGTLCGWTASHERPTFDIITGVSTGALIAPCAFIGSSYDHIIRDIYTNTSDADIMKQNIIEFLFEGRPSLMDTGPLKDILKKSVTMDILNAVAKAHNEGRRLYIITSNLDARRLVLWDMGTIASIGTPQALELFRTIMLASASIPVAFPPVMITVEAGGKLYDEMHVDGSVGTQLFGALLLVGPVKDEGVKTNVYLIRNGKIADLPGEVKYKIWDIASASFSTLITWQSYGDLYRFAALAKQGSINLYMTFIPYEFNESRKGEFDQVYMRKLFNRGYESAKSGKCWVDYGESAMRQLIVGERTR